MTDKYNGFELFNDIEDVALRTRNRAVVLSNMYQDHSKNGKVSPQWAAKMLQYFQHIPEGERKQVQDKFVEDMRSRGFVVQK